MHKSKRRKAARSAITGRFVTAKYALKHPNTTFVSLIRVCNH